jgi:YVTN family beta-propeller protein
MKLRRIGVAISALVLAGSLFVIRGRAQAVASDAAPTHVFVVNTQDASVSLVELATLKEVKRFTVGPRPYGVAVSRDGKTVAVSVEDEEKIKFYDTADFKLKGEVRNGKLKTLGKIAVGKAPKRVAFFSQKASGGRTAMSDFSKDKLGEAPRNVTTALTGNGNAGKWVVLKDGARNVLAQTDEDATSYRFPLAIFDQITAKDADISVKFKPVSGKKDQAAGLVWRLRDKDNYYIVRANALENNVVLYKVQDGKRQDLPLKGEGRTYGKKANVPKNEWSELRVTVSGKLFTVYLNGVRLYEVEDETFPAAGKVALWTKADSVTYFDDLKVVFTAGGQTRQAEKPAEQTPVVVFVCEHGATKSVVAAALFNKLAGDRGLNIRALARGTNPDAEIGPLAARGLQADGLKLTEATPKKISQADLPGARRVITFCALPDGYPGEVKVESWDKAPSISEDYGKARDWLAGRINRLLEELKTEKYLTTDGVIKPNEW